MITFAVISGGEGKRFGSDKTRALLADKELYCYGLELGMQVSDDVMLVSRDSKKYAPFINSVKYLEDELPHQCPMAGLITTARHAKHDYIFTLSADTPLLDKRIVDFLCDNAKGFDACIPSIDGKLWNLAACYSKSTLLNLLPYYEKGHYKLVTALSDFNINIITEQVFTSNDIDYSKFININTPSDIEKATRLLDNLII